MCIRDRSYVVRVTAPDAEELKRRCDAVRDFYDDMNVKLVRPVGDMAGLHHEFIPAGRRYMNDYIQYVTCLLYTSQKGMISCGRSAR